MTQSVEANPAVGPDASLGAEVERLRFGVWTADPAHLPCFDLQLRDDDAPAAPFRHVIAAGKLSALTDRWGNIHPFTTDGGFIWFTSPASSFARSSMYLMARIGSEWFSLLHSELTERGGIRIGLGYVEYRGALALPQGRLQVTQSVYASAAHASEVACAFQLQWSGRHPLVAEIQLRSDIAPSDETSAPARVDRLRAYQAGDSVASCELTPARALRVYLRGEQGWSPAAGRGSLRLEQTIHLTSASPVSLTCAIGYGHPPLSPISSLPALQAKWRVRLPRHAGALKTWHGRECMWTLGQLLSFENYDAATRERYIALGGYGWNGFGIREVAETALVLARVDPDLARASLRMVAKTQLASGDIPKFYNCRPERTSSEFESDTELWFILAVMECVHAIASSICDELCAYWDHPESTTLWEHAKRAYRWIRDEIGTGSHGLLRMRDGDWNDYLSRIGSEGRGESVMNTGIACRAFAQMSQLARLRGEVELAEELAAWVSELRRAVANTHDQWFLRGYTDDGAPVGSRTDDRVFVEAQCWAVLGGCGTSDQRRSALLAVSTKCHTSIGVTLMSRPYSSPAPDDISWCAIPAGEGENGGVWPQVCHWYVWALAEQGLHDVALREWESATLRAHARAFPEIPYGIFNGPDCYSSRLSSGREGWTQTQLLDRAAHVPMNPSVAWQAFSYSKLHLNSVHGQPRE